MRASGISAEKMRVIEKQEHEHLRTIGIARVGVLRITGFNCTTIFLHNLKVIIELPAFSFIELHFITLLISFTPTIPVNIPTLLFLCECS